MGPIGFFDPQSSPGPTPIREGKCFTPEFTTRRTFFEETGWKLEDEKLDAGPVNVEVRGRRRSDGIS
jgi:hypothetical protein